MKIFLTSIFVLLVASQATTEDKPEAAPVIETLSGKVVGIKEESTKGIPFNSYYGIPFAQPPTGDLRFKKPVKVDNWEGVRECSKYPPKCPQFGKFMMDPGMKGDEDCLYLNIFSHGPIEVNEDEKMPLFPVMVYFHGGAFVRGGGSDYPPHVMMNENITLVVIQYRLGILGFLSTEDEEVPGNMGLRDQMMALTWIQNNAHLFGGNPTKITVFGQSAGAASIHYQLLSPRPVGLFNRAILMSGSAICPFASGGAFKEAAEYTASIFNCTITDGSQAMISCLQKVPVEDLVPVQLHFTQWFMNPYMFGPRLDNDFLPADPEVLMKEKRHKRLDLMAGVTSHEGALYSIPIFANEGYRSALLTNFPTFGPTSMEFSDGDFSPLNQTIQIFDYYLKGINLDPDHADNITQMFSDRYFNIPHDLTTELHSKNLFKHKKKVFRYEFTHKGQRSTNDMFGMDIGSQYVSHNDDLFYLFTGGVWKSLENEEDLKMRDMMTKMWANFATYGNPTPEDAFDFQWEPVTQDKFHHLNIKLKPEMEDYQRSKVREFWTSLPLKQNFLLFPDKISNLTAITNDEVKKMEEDAKASLDATIAEAKKVIEAAKAAKEAKEKEEGTSSSSGDTQDTVDRPSKENEQTEKKDNDKEINKKDEL